jgi:hypothetical protein
MHSYHRRNLYVMQFNCSIFSHEAQEFDHPPPLSQEGGCVGCFLSQRFDPAPPLYVLCEGGGCYRCHGLEGVGGGKGEWKRMLDLEQVAGVAIFHLVSNSHKIFVLSLASSLIGGPEPTNQQIKLIINNGRHLQKVRNCRRCSRRRSRHRHRPGVFPEEEEHSQRPGVVRPMVLIHWSSAVKPLIQMFGRRVGVTSSV